MSFLSITLNFAFRRWAKASLSLAATASVITVRPSPSLRTKPMSRQPEETPAGSSGVVLFVTDLSEVGRKKGKVREGEKRFRETFLPILLSSAFRDPVVKLCLFPIDLSFNLSGPFFQCGTQRPYSFIRVSCTSSPSIWSRFSRAKKRLATVEAICEPNSHTEKFWNRD